MTLHQVHRLVQLALGATAVGFAALAGTFRKSAPKKPLAGGQLGNAGPEVAFGGREYGADEGFDHILYHILYKIGTKSKSKHAIRICSSLGSGLKHLSNQTIGRAKEFGCGLAAFSPCLSEIPSDAGVGRRIVAANHVFEPRFVGSNGDLRPEPTDLRRLPCRSVRRKRIEMDRIRGGVMGEMWRGVRLLHWAFSRRFGAAGPGSACLVHRFCPNKRPTESSLQSVCAVFASIPAKCIG